jgi:hypothetical protein
VEARAAAARRGEARRGPAPGGERGRGCWGGTWHRGERRGGQLVLGTWPARAAGHGREQSRGGGLEVDEGGKCAQKQKCRVQQDLQLCVKV